jgi:hypothetical protein
MKEFFFFTKGREGRPLPEFSLERRVSHRYPLNSVRDYIGCGKGEKDRIIQHERKIV